MKFSDYVQNLLQSVATSTGYFLVLSLMVVSVNPVHAAIGRTPGSAGVDANGIATYTLPLWVPDGAAGMRPELSLRYRHSGANGRLGVGWSIGGIGAITRCNKTIAQDGENSAASLSVDDAYCLDGNRLRLVSGQYGMPGSTYRTELESFARIRANGSAGEGPASFTVETSDGLIYDYGTTGDSRIESVGSETARAWALAAMRDRAGNTVTYDYLEDEMDGSFRPETIYYATNTAAGLSSPPYRVDLVYEAAPRPDPVYGYWGGDDTVDGRIRQFYRLDKLEIGHDEDFDDTFDTVKIYDLGYEAGGGAGGRSRLHSVTECAATVADCLSPTTFAWTDSTQGFQGEENSGVSIPPATLQHYGDLNGDGLDDVLYLSGNIWCFRLATGAGFGSESNTGISDYNHWDTRVIEWNGDGLLDFLVPHQNGKWYVYTFNGTGFNSGINTTVDSNIADSLYAAKDVNGDGLDDLVRVEDDIAWGLRIHHRLNTGSAFASSESLHWSQPDSPGGSDLRFEALPGGDFRNRMRQRRLDFDGDGREDYLVARRNSTYRDELSNWLHVDTWMLIYGAGGSTAAFQKTKVSTLSDPLFAWTPVMGDFNGDGLTDLAWSDGTSSGSWEIRHSNGQAVTANIPGPSAFYMASNFGAVTDYDHDGRDDIMVRYDATNDWYVYRGTESGLSVQQPMGINSGPYLKIAEIDGNGFPDIAYAGGTLKYRLSYHNPSDLLSSATDGFGVTAIFDYGLLTDPAVYTKGTGAVYPQIDIEPARFVVKTLSQTDGTGSGSTFDLYINYFGARQDAEGRGFLGFERRNIVDGSAGYDQKIEELYLQSFPFTGMLDRVYIRQANGMTIRDTDYTHAQLAWGSGATNRVYPYATDILENQYEVGGDENGTLYRTVHYSVASIDNSSGLIADSSVETTEIGTGINPGSSKTSRQHHTSIFNDTANWCLGRPETTRRIQHHTLASGASITRTTGQTWNGSMCRPSQHKIEPGNVLWEVIVGLGYDDFGNLDQRTATGASMLSRITGIDWGDRGQFPEAITDALGFLTDLHWNYDLGTTTAVTDPNGVETEWLHDSFGRQTSELRPDGTSTSWVINQCATGCDSREVYRIDEKVYDDDSFLVRTDTSLFDQHEGLILDRRQLPLGNTSVAAEIERDARGRVERIHAPYWAGGARNGYRELAYDVLDRVVGNGLYNVSDVLDRETSIAFEGLEVATTDPRGYVTRQTMSAWGDILRVLDPGTGTTTYQYNSFAELKKVADNSYVVVADIGYNAVGMRISLDDADRGFWSYTPNALGEVVSQTDAKFQTSTFEYDKLGRLTTRLEDEGASIWTWGTSSAANNIGRLASLSGPDGYTELFNYDGIGRLDSRTIVADRAYTYLYHYNSIGKLHRLNFPLIPHPTYRTFNVSVEYGYQRGYLTSIDDVSNDGNITYWAINNIDPRGNSTAIDLGNGVGITSGFDALTGLVSFKKSGLGNPTDRQNLSYLWDKSGNLKERSDLRQSLTESFYYDGLNRLDYSKLGTVTNLDMQYYPNGNIKKKDNVSSADYVYDSDQVHAVLTAGPNTFTYDANGNVETRNGVEIDWTSYNKPKRMEEGKASIEFLYAPDRRRWKKIDSNGDTTIYVGGLLEKTVSAGPLGSMDLYNHTIQAPDGTVIKRIHRGSDPAEVQYVLTDHLGSIDVVLDDDGAVIKYSSFDAFGLPRDPTDWSGPGNISEPGLTNRGYTQHEHLDHFDLIHMNGRIQDPVVGRFISADPYIQSPYSSQSLNRYSYVNNNPLSYTDPGGFASCDFSCQQEYPYFIPPPGYEYIHAYLTSVRFGDRGVFRPTPPPTPPAVPAVPNNTTQIDTQDLTLAGVQHRDNGEISQAGLAGDGAEGSVSYPRGVSRFVRQAGRRQGAFGPGQQVQSSIVEERLLSEILVEIAKRPGTAVRLGLDSIKDNPAKFAGRAGTGYVVKKLLQRQPVLGKVGGAAVGYSLTALAIAGDLQTTVEALATALDISVLTVDARQDILPQLAAADTDSAVDAVVEVLEAALLGDPEGN